MCVTNANILCQKSELKHSDPQFYVICRPDSFFSCILVHLFPLVSCWSHIGALGVDLWLLFSGLGFLREW